MSQEKSTRIPQDCMEAATLGGRPKGIGPLTVWSESCIVQTRREAASMLRCAALNGKPFWANGVCPTYASRNKQGINDCSAYRQFPCEQFINHYDHSNSEDGEMQSPEHQFSLMGLDTEMKKRQHYCTNFQNLFMLDVHV